MLFDSSSLTYLQTQTLNQNPQTLNQHSKKPNKAIFATHQMKSEQPYQTSNVSKSFLYNQGQGQNQQQQIQKRSNNSQSIAQNLSHAFFAQSENKNPPKATHVNSNGIAKPSFSSCMRDSRMDNQIQESRCETINVHSALMSPPCHSGKFKSVQSNYIMNSNITKIKQPDPSQSQYSRSTKDSNIYEEQLTQMRTEISHLIQHKEDTLNMQERLIIVETSLNQLRQFGVFQIVETLNQLKVDQSQYLVNYHLKCQDIEIKTDQVEYNYKDLRKQNIEQQIIVSNLKEQFIEMKQLHHENVEATQKILQQELQDLKSQFSQILITKSDVEKTLHKIIQDSALNTTQSSSIHLNTTCGISPNSTRPQEQETELTNQYINRYEQFNREVTNYMASRQVQVGHNQNQYLSPNTVYDCNNICQDTMLDEMDQAGSLNQSDVESLENYDLNNSILQRNSTSPSNYDGKLDNRFMKQQNDSYQFDLYDLSKHQQVSKSIEIDNKIKNIYRCNLSAIQEHQMEESCIEVSQVGQQFLLDEQGYLLDSQGQHIFDFDGVQVRLTENQINQLRESNRLIELK